MRTTLTFFILFLLSFTSTIPMLISSCVVKEPVFKSYEPFEQPALLKRPPCSQFYKKNWEDFTDCRDDREDILLINIELLENKIDYINRQIGEPG